jgi:hypothetical protein
MIVDGRSAEYRPRRPGDDHSLTRGPGVVRLREAAAALGEDVWIAVRLPGDDKPGSPDLTMVFA